MEKSAGVTGEKRGEKPLSARQGPGISEGLSHIVYGNDRPQAEGGIQVEDRKIYEDIALRTEGDIYIGVVGPVRTGKSTFIKRSWKPWSSPTLKTCTAGSGARDELPQSGSGRTIMTAEPKFVPEEAVTVSMEGGGAFQVRLNDCVGYMVTGAVGQLEGEEERMVTTPWFDHEIPMSEAAEIGTRRWSRSTPPSPLW